MFNNCEDKICDIKQLWGDDFRMIPGPLEIPLWAGMIRSLVYHLRTRQFYAWKSWYDMLFKIPQRNSLTFPWYLSLFRISQIPWQFPDLEKIKFSLTFPWRVATLFTVTSKIWMLCAGVATEHTTIASTADDVFVRGLNLQFWHVVF